MNESGSKLDKPPLSWENSGRFDDQMAEPAKKLILIVEDDAATQQLLVALLRRDGFDAVVASDGRQAIDVLSRQPFAAVILDLMMPEVGGREVVEYLTREKRKEGVIVCTAAGAKSVAELRGDAVKAIVRKPFDIDELSAAVRSVAS